MNKNLLDLQKKLDVYWRTEYADKIRREQIKKERSERASQLREEGQQHMMKISEQAEAYQQAMGMNKERTKRQKANEHRRNVDSKLSEIRLTVRSMNEYQTLVLDRENRLKYDNLKTRLKNLLETIHILDEDAWKIADRYVQDNLIILSIW